MNSRRGNVMVILASGALLFVGLLALVVDVGLWYGSRSQVQTLADVAALEVLQRHPENPDSERARQTALAIFATNSISLRELTLRAQGSETLDLSVELPLERTFSRVFFKDRLSLRVSSQATRSDSGQVLLRP